MYAPDSPGGKDFDVRMFAGEHRSCHSGAAAGCPGDDCSKIAWPDFMRFLLIRQPSEFGLVQSDMEASIQKSDGGWGCALLANRALHIVCQCQVLWTRQSM